METVFTICMYLVVILALILIYKIFKGPTVIDRIVAGDCLDLILGTSMVLYGSVEKVSFYTDLGIIISLLGFVGTLLICKYLEGKL